MFKPIQYDKFKQYFPKTQVNKIKYDYTFEKDLRQVINYDKRMKK